MKTRNSLLVAPALIILALLWATAPVCATEGGLLGVQIGSTPRNLVELYGYPAGIIFSSGNGLSLNTMREGIVDPLSGNTPPDWAKTVWPAKLQPDQQMWIYQLKGGVVGGFVFKGIGDAATITDIIATSFAANPKVKTEGGVSLGDDFRKVLMNYGYPPLIQPFTVSASRATAGPTPGTGPLRATGLPNFNRPLAGPQQAQSRGLRAQGTGPVAPLGAINAPVGDSKVIVVDQRPISFARNCVVLYDGLAFTFYNFKVVRIQLTQ
jgi:hypothetical protein